MVRGVSQSSCLAVHFGSQWGKGLARPKDKLGADYRLPTGQKFSKIYINISDEQCAASTQDGYNFGTWKSKIYDVRWVAIKKGDKLSGVVIRVQRSRGDVGTPRGRC